MLDAAIQTQKAAGPDIISARTRGVRCVLWIIDPLRSSSSPYVRSSINAIPLQDELFSNTEDSGRQLKTSRNHYDINYYVGEIGSGSQGCKLIVSLPLLGTGKLALQGLRPAVLVGLA